MKKKIRALRVSYFNKPYAYINYNTLFNKIVLDLKRSLMRRCAITSLIIDALSRWDATVGGRGKTCERSENISLSLLLLDLAASLDFSFLFSLFLKKKGNMYIYYHKVIFRPQLKKNKINWFFFCKKVKNLTFLIVFNQYF